MQAFKSTEFARKRGYALLSAFHNQRDCVCFLSGYAHSADYNICKIAQNFLHFDCNRLVAFKHDSDNAYSFHNYLFCAVGAVVFVQSTSCIFVLCERLESYGFDGASEMKNKEDAA